MNYKKIFRNTFEKLLITIIICFPYYLSIPFTYAKQVEDTNSKKKINFRKLPTIKDLKEQNNTGKIDIFSYGDSNTNLSTSLKLLGVFSAGNKKYAIVNYNDRVGEIVSGDIGGKDTKYLPDNFKLVNVDINSFSIVVKSNEKFYQIKG